MMSVPAVIRCLKNLTTLWVLDAPLEELPESIGDLQNLCDLRLGNDVYVELKENVYGTPQNTNFRRLPDGMTRLKNLETLLVENTAISTLPADFGALENLAYLDLSCNEIVTLPDSMARLKNLRRLRIGGNKLTKLPKWIKRFEKLEHLTIAGNPLKEVPAWLGEMPGLLSLRCSNDQKPPMLARMKRKLSLPLGKLQVEFLEQVGELGFELPEEDVAARKHGTLGDENGDGGYGYGDTCEYLFGREKKGEYVDYYIAHRIWGDRHVRIWETGESERLETFSVMFNSPEEVTEIGGRLSAKGFSPTH
jgi:hypothetical protein